jgi:SAM-dependent methyltransferase
MPFYKDHIYPYLVDTWVIRLHPQNSSTDHLPGTGKRSRNRGRLRREFPSLRSHKSQQALCARTEPGNDPARRRTTGQNKADLEFLDLPGERIPLDDHAVDCIVSTFTLCTILGIKDALREIARILKPDGKLVFFELGLSPDPAVQRWQKRLEPVFHWMFQGLYLTRDIPAPSGVAGFRSSKWRCDI